MPASAALSPSEARPKTPRTYADRWKHPELLQSGYVVVPTDFLRYYGQLKPHGLTHGEALFVIHLMEFKWDQAAPFPSYATLARQVGVTAKMARRYAQGLQRKGCLRRVVRTGNTNLFDLTPLFDKLLKIVQTAVPARRRPTSDEDIPF